MTGRFDISDVLNDLAARLPAVLDIAGAGVTLVSGTELSFATANSERAVRLERFQEERNAGPCADAITSGEDVLIRDLAERAQEWPEYVATAAGLGIVAVAALPLRNSVKLGALDLYDTRGHDWTRKEVTTARVFADIATGYVLSASELERERRTVEQLEVALASRVVIEQAKGILANANGISVDAAFVRLRKYARGQRWWLPTHVVLYVASAGTLALYQALGLGSAGWVYLLLAPVLPVLISLLMTRPHGPQAVSTSGGRIA